MSLGVIGKMQVLGAFAALDRMNDGLAPDQCGWCNGRGKRNSLCRASEGCATCAAGVPHIEICGYCEGSGLAVELGVAG